MQKVSTFEVVLLIAGITTTILGFQLINQVFVKEGGMSWLMVIAIFNWLMLLVLFVSLSLAVDVTKKQLNETRHLVEVLTQKKGRK
jgi:hypothetical protein|tara:strand:+ start:2547 stop:2804 length:258 start_codon:yes stop_codon:yes gene_type:complete